ncbi:tRNA (N(6)-L-threonylcarbamoyladenosine(37)-C(2))-methylthiotransferase MtaB [Desulfitibacter alkalitolerans]|uniref:tRNA (N(6)-L-threonylcarbamoyladenosine(37)-C(2))- methylthiotransferase MtaB n=1 Tax=Desulfitibacter alkalitolerans TaxID=264641 RepID=UPI000AB7A264|nr:tRNA (N(6)-L-threonylcarbamoyladenosine(37)-C(2))-methylthiotransferase MtaB [Desulfitibacter alkalitolerans]
MKKVAVHVLGCKVNQYEIEGIKELFRERHYKIVDFDEKADVYVIHTCTVTHLGDRKSRQYIRKAVKNNPHAIVAVTGCYAQVSPQEVEKIEGVDIVLGTRDRKEIVDVVEKCQKGRQIKRISDSMLNKEFEELPVFKPSRARAFLKIQEGCDRFCTYCIVPYARGPIKSRDFHNTILEIENLVNNGFQEIVLTGVHLGTYGKDLGKGINLFYLLSELVKISGLKRLRISSLDPDEIDTDLLELMTENEKICPHYHIPLQSGDDLILQKMGRKYTLDDYRRLVTDIRNKRPEAAFTTDVIVGFPGETEELFANTKEFIKEIGFADLHVFKYSPRKGTPAAKYPNQVSTEAKTQRSNELIELSNVLWANYAQGFLGRKAQVLVETKINTLCEGHTGNYLKVRFEANQEDLIGKIISVKLEKIGQAKELLGTVIL